MNTYLIALLLAYAAGTGLEPFRLVADNLGRDTSGCYLQPQHRVQWGDLNTDGVVNQTDADLYNSMMPPFGWSISAGSKVHWYKDCQYIKGKTVYSCLIENRGCLTCTARKLRTTNYEL
jgi:hypothetical protein